MGKHKYSTPNPTPKMNLELFPATNPIPKSKHILILSLVIQIKLKTKFLFFCCFFGNPGGFAPSSTGTCCIWEAPAPCGRQQMELWSLCANTTQRKGNNSRDEEQEIFLLFYSRCFSKGGSIPRGIKGSWIWEDPWKNCSFSQWLECLGGLFF